MVVESFPDFFQWLGDALPIFGLILLVAAVLGVFFGYVVASFRHGPFEAFYVVAQVIAQAIPDFLLTSPRRVFALARLAIKEALRRRVILVTFGIFAALLLFGGWFMNTGSENPDQIYVNFVLWGTQLLVLLMGMLISAFSLPEDIKNKTIFTVVTKPVRSTEIVLGRIVGFGLLGTALLALMGIISFLFVWRGLSHTHQIAGDTQTLASFQEIDPNTKLSRITGKRASENAIMEVLTTSVAGHNHRLELIEDIREKDAPQPRYMGNVIEQEPLEGDRTVYRRVICDNVGSHSHRVIVEGTGRDAKISLSPAIGYFRARVPLYAEKLQFYDRRGQLEEKGINVGKVWDYRGFVDGGTSRIRSSLSKAEFDFSGFEESIFRETDILPLEMTLGVFRTYKGDIEKRVTAGLQISSIPDQEGDPVYRSELLDFETNEYTIQTLPLPRKMIGEKLSADGKLLEKRSYDLFDDYGSNGKLRITLTCRDLNQYIGVARADVYFRAGDKVYWVNFLKGYLGIWCQMMIIIAMGVAFSTFLSAPVTMLATIVMIIVGFFTTFIRQLMTADSVGGGPIESFIRVITQKNMVTELETGWLTTIVENSDRFITSMLKATTYLAPDFASLNFADFLTYGYNIDSQRIWVAIAITIGFCFGLSVLGYFALKTREIAK
jgi:hypothetical protein